MWSKVNRLCHSHVINFYGPLFSFSMVRYSKLVSIAYKCPKRRRKNDVIETETGPMFLLHHSNTNLEDINAMKMLALIKYLAV